MPSRFDRSFELQQRLDRLGKGCLRLAPALCGKPGGGHVADQLIRAGTAPAAHYAEARRSMSHPDFVHRLGLAAKEAGETLVWLGFAEVLAQSDAEVATLRELRELADGACAQLTKSALTARRSSDSRR